MPRSKDLPRFRVRWHGYDRAEVDTLLRQLIAERKQLQADLARVKGLMAARDDTLQQELERLATLRAEVMNCLGVSVTALRTAAGKLPSAAEPVPAEAPTPAVTLPMPTWWHAWQHSHRAWKVFGWRHLLMGGVSAAAAVLLVLALGYHPRASRMSAAQPAAAAHDVALATESTHTGASPEIPARPIDGLLLTLSARVPCWIRTVVDGNKPLERLLKADETIIVRATNEVVLRVGDAAALALLINGQPAKPLGAPGQVSTTRITRTNYSDFVARTGTN